MKKREINTREEARQHAIDWQNWASEAKMSYEELLEWQSEMRDVALNWGLQEDFEENGII